MKDTKMKTNDINQLVTDFTKVITYKIITTIRNHYGSLESFKTECNSQSNKSLARYNINFHVDSKILQALTRTSDGKRHLDEVLSMLNPKELVYKHKFDWKFKSGKKFSKPSTFYIPFEQLEKLFALEDTELSPFMTTTKFYTKTQHKMIDKYILGYRKPRKEYDKDSDKFRKSVEARKTKAIAKIVSKNSDSMTDDEALELVNQLDI